jgi:hypothetical protein
MIAAKVRATTPNKSSGRLSERTTVHCEIRRAFEGLLAICRIDRLVVSYRKDVIPK